MQSWSALLFVVVVIIIIIILIFFDNQGVFGFNVTKHCMQCVARHMLQVAYIATFIAGTWHCLAAACHLTH